MLAENVVKLGLIPARGGSKRLPRKNIMPLDGRPMIAWTVAAALESGCFDQVVVSTEDTEIAAIARQAGAEVLDRPAALAGDDIPLVEVARHAAKALTPDMFCLLMPNCPLRNAGDIVASYRAFIAAPAADAMMSVTSYHWLRPDWALERHDGMLRRIEWHGTKGGDAAWCPSGAIRWTRRAAFETNPTWYPRALDGYEMPWHRAIDIDVIDDFRMAECVLAARRAGFTFADGAAS